MVLDGWVREVDRLGNGLLRVRVMLMNVWFLDGRVQEVDRQAE